MYRIIIGLLLLFPALAWSQVEFEADSTNVESIRSAALHSGKLLPFNTFPASAVDLQNAYDNLFPLGTDYIMSGKQWVHNGIYGRFGFDLNLDGTLSNDVEPFWNEYNQYIVSTEPFSQIRLGLQDEKQWGIFVAINIEQQFAGIDYTNHTNLPIPLPGKRSVPIEYHFLEAGYLWYNLSPLEITIGRSKLHYGPLRNSLIISDRIPFLDMVRLHLPMGEWNFDYAVASLETRTGGGGTSIDRSVYLVTHRIDWGLPGIRFGFNEQALLDRNKVDANGNIVSKGDYVITDFLPIISYHQAEISPFNTSIALDFDWAVAPDWRIAGQYGLDEVNAQDIGIPDNPIPTIWGFILGTEFQGRAENLAWNWYTEIGYTHYLWGNFDDNLPFAKAIYHIILDNGTQEMPLTSPYGPGTAWVNTKASLKGDIWSASVSIEIWNTKDGVSLYIPYQETGGTGGLGSIWNYRLRLLGSVKTGPVEWTIEPALLARNMVITPQLTVGGHLSLNISGHEDESH